MNLERVKLLEDAVDATLTQHDATLGEVSGVLALLVAGVLESLTAAEAHSTAALFRKAMDAAMAGHAPAPASESRH